MIPLDAPRAAIATMTALTRTGYMFTNMRPHPATGQPLARMIMTGPRWVLVLVGLLWLAAYGLYRLPLTRSFGAALILHRVARQPIIYVDAAGVAH